MKASLFCLLTIGLLAFSGCSTLPSASRSMVKTELYFGATKGNGGTVSEKEWQSFLDTEITPRFPDGLTIIDSKGQWRTKQGKLIREKTWLLLLVHQPSREDSIRIQKIRNTYQQRFDQELVLEVTVPVRASF